MRPVIAKLAKMLTDGMDVKTGLVKMSEDRWEYKMLSVLLTDEMAELMPAQTDHGGVRRAGKIMIKSMKGKSEEA